jgi:hypothetical protein
MRRADLRASFVKRGVAGWCCFRVLASLLLAGLSVTSYASGAVPPIYNPSAPPIVKYMGWNGQYFDMPEQGCIELLRNGSQFQMGGFTFDHIVPAADGNAIWCYGLPPWQGDPNSYPVTTVKIMRSCDGIDWRNYAMTCGMRTCPANSTGTPAINPTTCTCNDGYAPDPAKTSCVQENLTITLYGGTTTEPGTSLPFIATVTNQDKQPPKNAVKVEISLKVDPTSGGHEHGSGDRPRGGIAGESVCESDGTCWSSTTYNGAVVFNFNAPEASGTHTITATCDGCNNTETKTVDVKVDGLSALTASPEYELVGAVIGKHTDNHYLSAPAKRNLMSLVDRYSKAYPAGPVLNLNDASLVWGGKFDVSGTWAGAHEEHRRGVAIDIRANQLPSAIPLSRFRNFKKLAAKSGGAFADVHCAFPSRFSWACWADTSPNRHFHVRLLGQRIAQ